MNITDERRSVFPEGFRGVWIPKEIWLDDRLELIDKCILTEIAALDGADGCFASNRHFAGYVGCSERRVTASVSKLVRLGLIVTERSGGSRIIRTDLAFSAGRGDSAGTNCEPGPQNIPDSRENISTPPGKNCEAASQNLLHSNTYNNIYNNTDNNINNNTDNISSDNIKNNNIDSDIISSDNISTDNIKNNNIDTDIISSDNISADKPGANDRESRAVIEVINSYTKNEELREALKDFVRMRQANRPINAAGLRLALGRLNRIAASDEDKLQSVSNTIMNGWAGFYPLKKEQKKSSSGVSSFDIEQWERYAESFVQQSLGQSEDRC